MENDLSFLFYPLAIATELWYNTGRFQGKKSWSDKDKDNKRRKPMEAKIYSVTIEERLARTIIVKAESPEQAYECVERHYRNNGDIILMSDDFVDSKIYDATEYAACQYEPDYDATTEKEEV